MRKKVILYSLSLLLITITYFAYSNYKKLTIISGHSSKYLCSCIFVSGRKAQDILSLDLAFSPISWAKHEIDYQNQKVTSSVFGMKTNTAIYRDGFGCTLLADYNEESLRKQIFPERSIAVPADSIFDLKLLSEKEKILQKKLSIAIAPEFVETDSSLLKNTTAITIAYDGKLIAEQYREGFTNNTPLLGWSMTKSITSSMVGILVKEGKLALYDPAPIPSWQNDVRGQITLNHLLQMTSGLDWDENYSRVSSVVNMLYKKGDMYSYVIQPKLKHSPGTHWYYSSGTTNILSGIIKDQFKDDDSYWQFPYKSLFDKIGMTSTWIEPDAAGMYVGSSYCFATARDWTRYGLLYYHQGVWNGDTILSPEWVEYTQSSSDEIPEGKYGAQWWLTIDKNKDGSLESIPSDLYLSLIHI